MKKKITVTILLLLLLIGQATFARTYYVSNSGNDNNSGTSTGSAWLTISKVNSFSFAANDVILFNRGDIFYGGIVIRRSSLSFGAYGSGADPIITGVSTVTGWVNLGGNIWEAPVTKVKSGVNLVLRNDIIQQVGRYPNTDASNGGYFTYTAATSTSITGSAQSSTTNWTGAEIAIKENRWSVSRQKVTSHSGGVVHFTTNPTVPRVNYGYFFQRDSRTLDRDGEWWHNVAGNKLRMYFSNNNPNSYTLEIATVDTLFKSQSFNNLVISDLSFDGSGKRSIWINGGSNITIKNCSVNNSGAEAITVRSALTVTIDNCNVTNSLGSGIIVSNPNGGTVNFLVQNCTLLNTAFLAGMETSNEGNGGEGIKCIGGNGVNVVYNTVTNSGYNGIKWQGNDVNIKYNFVEKFNFIRDDGAGIYSWEESSTPPARSNRKVIGNIVVNGIGSHDGTSDETTSVQGLYFDLGTKNVIIDSNTVAYVTNGAFHGNNCGNLSISNNVFFGNGRTSSLQRFAGAPLIRNITMKKNILFPYRFRYRNLAINSPAITKEDDIEAMGIVDSNYYALGLKADTSLTTVTTNIDGTDYQEEFYAFPYVTGTVGIEKHSTKFANNATIEYNATNSPRIVSFSGLSKKDVYGKVYNNSATIPAWRSIVLLPNGTSSTTNQAPKAIAGANQVITLPINTVTLTGSAADTDGSITKYSWAKISGPSSGTIVSPLGAVTTILNLVEGVYQYQLTVTDDDGATGKDTVQVTVNAVIGGNLLPAVNPANTINGLDYEYYEGNWIEIPSFSALNPVKSGIVSNFDLNPADLSSDYGFTFTGYINVPSDGMYTFYTSSTDGSNLYIDDVLVVQNGGLHDGLLIERSGIIGLKAGKHAIRVVYFFNSGTAVLNVSYAASGILKQAIPSSALYRVNSLLPAVNPANTVNGLDYKYYEGEWLELPAFSTLSPVKTGTVSNFDLSPARTTDRFGFTFTGYVTVPSDGSYTFFTYSDDGSELYIDNVLVVSNDGLHGPVEEQGAIGLKAGKHAIKVLFFQRGGGSILTVSYSGNDISKRAIPSSVLYRVNTSARMAVGNSLNSIPLTNVLVNENKTLRISGYPNPSYNEFGLRLEGGSDQKVEISVIAADGKAVYKTTGATNKTYKFGNNFMPGLYLIKVIQDNKIQTLKVIKTQKPI